ASLLEPDIDLEFLTDDGIGWYGGSSHVNWNWEASFVPPLCIHALPIGDPVDNLWHPLWVQSALLLRAASPRQLSYHEEWSSGTASDCQDGRRYGRGSLHESSSR
ncbi:hypothetical protein FOZ63_015104, partial [Perkinsus olseni]